MLYGVFTISGPQFSNLDPDNLSDDFILSLEELMRTQGRYVGQVTKEGKLKVSSNADYNLGNLNACHVVGQAIKSGDWDSCESKTLYFGPDQNYHGGFVKVCKIHQR